MIVKRELNCLNAQALCESIKESGPGHEPVYAYLDLAEPEKVPLCSALIHSPVNHLCFMKEDNIEFYKIT